MIVKVIEEQTGYRALTAAQDIHAGSVIMCCSGTYTKEPTRHTIQLDDTVHLDLDCEVKFTNHSCNPNAAIQIQGSQVDLVAIKDIKRGSVVTYNYNTTELCMQEPFKCFCGADCCYVEVKGFQFLSDQKKSQLLPLVSPFIKKYAQEKIGCV